MRRRCQGVVPPLRPPVAVSPVQTIVTDPTAVLVLAPAPAPTVMTAKIAAAEVLRGAEEEAHLKADEVITGPNEFLK